MKGNFRKFLWTAYDHLGGLIVVNLLWGILSIPWMVLAYILVAVAQGVGERSGLIALILAVEGVLFSPPTILLFCAGRIWAQKREVDWRDLLAEGRHFAARAQAIGAALVLATFIVLVNIHFYQGIGGWAGLLLGGTMIWFAFGLALVGVYVFPVLVSQDGSVWHTLRQSFLLAIDNIKLSFGLLLAALFMLGVGALSGIGLFCGAGATLALLLSVYFWELLPKYTGAEHSQEPHRSLREVLRPWEA